MSDKNYKCKSVSFSRGSASELVFPYFRQRYCRYYQQNRCMYGNRCKFIHDKLSPPNSPAVSTVSEDDETIDPDTSKLCYNFTFCECKKKENCPYVHGEACPYCDLAFLHPTDEQQKREHLEKCEIYVREEMNLAFGIQLGQQQTCSICLEEVYKKEKYTHQRFGIMENCDHVYCLHCIRHWRSVSKKTKCPLCQVKSNFVVPYEYWYESQERKEEIINAWKAVLSTKKCKYFGTYAGCPFGENCFYKHDQMTVPKAPSLESIQEAWDTDDQNISDSIVNEL
ncbi:e3 ubiquitin-protein ligase makorin-1 [Nephila pilipes]|uniref:RING-type E3 ubiquitin transferase n=1 Tax=Nephila pilipes TaxID=299642 RepID=A0A8X6ULA5_NEPPI|nr:e3 ubiquitin-protein ligase makorin-1 [Nephila pilipes]